MYHRLRYRYRYDYLASSAAANTMTVFVAALEDLELLCSVVSDTGTETVSDGMADVFDVIYVNIVT
jgi:hypothetical protein